MAKAVKYKSKRFSGTTLSRESATFIRKLAARRGVPVYRMVDLIISEWAGWKEPEMKESLDTVYEKE